MKMKKAIKYFLGSHDFFCVLELPLVLQKIQLEQSRKQISKKREQNIYNICFKIFPSKTSKIYGWLFKICR